MDDVIKFIVLNGGLSVNSGISFFNIMENTFYNEDTLQFMSDVPRRTDNANRVVAGMATQFADKNLR